MESGGLGLGVGEREVAASKNRQRDGGEQGCSWHDLIEPEGLALLVERFDRVFRQDWAARQANGSFMHWALVHR